MNKFLIAAITLALATPALAQGMAAHDTMAGPSAMAHDGMKMDHKKPAKKTAMKHDAMGAGMAHDGMNGPASSAGMSQGSMSGPGH
jgi:hypothetical protein